MTVIHHGCGGHFHDGTCRRCGQRPDGTRPVPAGVDQARAALRDAEPLHADGTCLAQGRMTLTAYLEATKHCTCPIHRKDPA